ncbi:T9SS C-terminal target domain-containing protein [Paludibacter sp. 221]|uniref:calycin-like domain-containing protein n=1 Tax=Paludibacter sp. 221 TaxID=2302939 RepID=UPI0013D7ADE1|nr:calycin-like domain-containing protein [Paludibacter sp. 221]NDV46657.1 T9SS C-terminal target domain-containing protein [Paludibacter sp. 221]
MKKILLICLSALCFLSFDIKAEDISGTYRGNLTVVLDNEVLPNTDITLSKEQDGDTYSLSIKNFNFKGLPLGDLKVGGITRSNDANGMVDLSKAGYSDGPKVALIEGLPAEPTYIFFTSASILNGNLELRLDIQGDPVTTPTEDTRITLVDFVGDKIATGISTPKNNPLTIYLPNPSTLQIPEGNGNYTIYSTCGAEVQSGIIENNTVDIANLKSGIYIIKTDKQVAKFIK